MFRFIVLLATLSAVTYGLNLQSEFKAFKARFNKSYSHPKEESYRYQVFTNNVDTINKHNERYSNGLESFRMGINQFTDLTFAEFSDLYLNLNVTSDRTQAPLIHQRNSTEGLPKTIDWRTKGIVNEVKNQGQCGSCWAFSTTASIEGAWAQAKKSLVSLSEQNLMDCSYAQGNHACRGGLIDPAFEYVIEQGGLNSEASYPYSAESSKTCKWTSENVAATISKYVDIPQRDEKALKNAAAERVVSVAINANKDLQHYESGIFDSRWCPGSRFTLNHAVAVVGYGEDYWIVRNSWGAQWGENGYSKFAFGKNLCGIASMASYPIV